MSGGNSHDRKKFEDAVQREVQRRLSTASESAQSETSSQETKPLRNQKSHKAKADTRAILTYFRAAGIGSFFFGLGTLFVAGWYWVGVGLIYATFLLIAADLWFEPTLNLLWRVLGILVVCLGIIAFSFVFVFVSAELPVAAYMTDGEYADGTDISGIAWKTQFTEVDVQFTNDTDRVYEDLNIVVRPTEAIAAIAQSTNVPGVSFEDKNNLTERMVDIDLQTGAKRAISLDLLATDAGYRMRCPRLPSHTVLRIVLALADIKWDPDPPSGRPIQEVIREPNYVQRMKADDFSTYWLGHKYGTVYASRPTSSEWLKVDGEYTVLQRRRALSTKIDIGGKINTQHF